MDQNGDGILDESEISRTISLSAAHVSIRHNNDNAVGASPNNRLQVNAAGPPVTYESIQTLDSQGNATAPILGNVVKTAPTNTPPGVVATGFTVAVAQQAGANGGGTWKVTVTAPAGASGDYNIRIFIANDPNRFVVVFIHV